MSPNEMRPCVFDVVFDLFPGWAQQKTHQKIEQLEKMIGDMNKVGNLESGWWNDSEQKQVNILYWNGFVSNGPKLVF